MRPLLVGEDNPQSIDPRYALWPWPINCAGWRLCYKVLGLTRNDYLQRFERVNLCKERWSLREARETAKQIKADRQVPLVLLGAKVCQAFGVAYEPLTAQLSLLPDRVVVILPHPSGRCRIWNDNINYSRAQKLLKELNLL